MTVEMVTSEMSHRNGVKVKWEKPNTNIPSITEEEVDEARKNTLDWLLQTHGMERFMLAWWKCRVPPAPTITPVLLSYFIVTD